MIWESIDIQPVQRYIFASLSTVSPSRYINSESPITVYFKRLGITVKFIDNDDLQAFEAAIDDKTKALYVESIGNPKYNVAPIPELASVSFF